MLLNKSLEMMLNASPIIFAVEKSRSNCDKVNHYFAALSEADKSGLVKGDSTKIAAFNLLAHELLNRAIELNTIDRYRRSITASIRAKQALEAAKPVNLDEAQPWPIDSAI